MTPREAAENAYAQYHSAIISGNRPSFVELVTQAIEHFQHRQKQEPICKEHPLSKGKRKPKNGCEECWRRYLWRKTC